MKPIDCPICSGKDYNVFSQRKKWILVRCKACKFEYVNPMPEDSDIQSEVKESEKYNNLTDQSAANLSHLYRGILRDIGKRVPIGQLLDVGCGPGILLRQARKLGWQTTGLELSKASIDTARSSGLHIIDVPLEDALLASESYDVVVLHHVLEHVVDPNLILAECSRLLRPGGLLFVAVPNARSWRVCYQGDLNAFVYQDDHLLFFDPVNLERLVTRHLGINVKTRTLRMDGRLGRFVERSVILRPIRRILELIGAGVEIRCIAIKDNCKKSGV